MKKTKLTAGMAFFFVFFAGIGIMGNPGTVNAAVSLSVDYEEEVITATTSGGSLYVSTDKEKNWDRIEEETVSGQGVKTNGAGSTSSQGVCAEFDISAILANKPVKVYFRENLTDESTEIELQGLTAIKGKQGITASGSVINITEVPAGRVVEYRRGNGSKWRIIDPKENKIAFTSSDGTAVGIYVNQYTITGMTFTFRLKATKTERVGKEIKVKVSKKANAPNIKVDGTKLMLSGLKANGSEYRFKDTEDFKKAAAKTILLSELFPSTKNSIAAGSSSTGSSSTSPSAVLVSQAGISYPISGGTIEVRTAATDKKAASRSKYVVVPSQEVLSSTDKIKITTKLSTKGVSQAAISISDASKDIPYEYTLLPSGTVSFDLEKQKWTAVTKTGEIIIKKTAGTEPANGVIILVRKKTTTNKTTKVVTPASTCYQEILKL